MELIKIEQLLKKYWIGDTSVEEEKELQRFFSEEEVPQHLESVATLFCSFRADRQYKKLDDDFDEALLSRIERSEKRPPVRRWLSVAAAIALLLAALSVQDMLPQKSSTGQEAVTKDTYEDPRLAYEQTREALLLLSTMMNKGTRQVEKLEKFHEAKQKVKPE
jgi:hypothetical protein